MYDYTLDVRPQPEQSVWSHTSLQPLASGVLTPFSYSMLAETMRRAWYDYYDQLGFSPPFGARLVRQYHGRAYLNLTLSAQLGAQHAGIEPPTFSINGEAWPVAAWEKPGLLASFKLGRNRKKIVDSLSRFQSEMDAITQRAREWYTRVHGLRWSQADILQVMEQIERTGAESLKVYFAVRHALDALDRQLMPVLLERASVPLPRSVVDGALANAHESIEAKIAERLQGLAELARGRERILTWLQAGDYVAWQTMLPNEHFKHELQALLHEYGHRAGIDGEIRLPRWGEDASPLLVRVLALATQEAADAENQPQVRSLLESINFQSKQTQEWVRQLEVLLPLQSLALNAFAYILAGTRHWALAASQEAMADQRIAQPDDIFFFEMEQVKEMMTGEWNISDRDEIRATAAARRTEYLQWQGIEVGELLVGNIEAHAT